MLFIKKVLETAISIRIGTAEEWKKIGLGSFVLVFTLSTACAISPEFLDGAIDFTQSFGPQSRGPVAAPIDWDGGQVALALLDIAGLTR